MRKIAELGNLLQADQTDKETAVVDLFKFGVAEWDKLSEMPATASKKSFRIWLMSLKVSCEIR